MSQPRRWLAAIMFTDMVGYTALGQRNEELSLALVEEQRALIRPILAKHFGREVKTMGDAFLVVFPNASDAVRCAYDIQRVIREFNLALNADKRIHVRIGLHLGEVVESRGDISGDAVNVASRIEPLAEDGGVCLSRQVYDHVQNKLDLSLISLGMKQLKNLNSPLEVFKMVVPWDELKGVSKTRLSRTRVAVLPIVSLTTDPEDEFFSDGLTEEMIAKLSQIQQLHVVSRTSVMRFKKTMKSLSEIGRELGVGSLIEGSMRKYGNKIRVSAKLIDVETDEHKWSQTYDRDLTDIFAIQSDIASNVAASLKISLLEDQKNKIERVPTRSPEAHRLYLKGRYFWNERTESGLNHAIEYFQKAIERDSNFALAYVGIADCYNVLGEHGYLPLAEAASKSKTFVKNALAIDDSLAEAHASLGCALSLGRESLAASIEFRRAIELNPNYATAYQWYAITLLGQQKKEEAVYEAKKARELDPFSLQIGSLLGAAYHCAGKQDDAQRELLACVELDPNFVPAHIWLAFVFAEKGMFEEAISEAEKLLNLSPNARSLSAVGYVYGVSGRTQTGQKIFDELLQKSNTQFVSPLDFAIICTGMARYEEAIDWLDKAYVQSQLMGHQLAPKWCDPLRTFKRFQDLITKLG